ncbi:MAG TPA: transglycosylase SLT domain-containing protein [Acidimicrobiia bacterium]
MRFARLFTALLAISLLASLVASGWPVARAQSAEDAEENAERAERQAETASGLVDEAVANRDALERQLADSITRMNELAARLSEVGSDLDRLASQVGYADIELAGIQADIEDQAVDAYMTVVASPSASLVRTSTVEKAMVASSVVEDVVADGRITVGELFAKRQDLEALKETYLASQADYQSLKSEVDAEVERYTSLYEEAEADVAAAIRDAEQASQAYLAALSAVDLAKAKEDERKRQEARQEGPTTTTSTEATTPVTNPSTPTTTAATTSTTSGGGGGGPWNHPPEVEQWRSLAQVYFPSNRVEEALRIIDCESNGDPNSVNPYSGASGLFQFLPSTWETTAPKAGFGGASPFDPEANIGSAAWLANRYDALGYYYWHPWNCKRALD